MNMLLCIATKMKQETVFLTGGTYLHYGIPCTGFSVASPMLCTATHCNEVCDRDY